MSQLEALGYQCSDSRVRLSELEKSLMFVFIDTSFFPNKAYLVVSQCNTYYKGFEIFKDKILRLQNNMSKNYFNNNIKMGRIKKFTPPFDFKSILSKT